MGTVFLKKALTGRLNNGVMFTPAIPVHWPNTSDISALKSSVEIRSGGEHEAIAPQRDTEEIHLLFKRQRYLTRNPANLKV